MQNVPPALLVRFLREHRSEWADYGIDAYSAASLKASPYAVPCARPGGFPSTQVILPLAHTVEHEEVTYSSILLSSLHYIYVYIYFINYVDDFDYYFFSHLVFGSCSVGGSCIFS